MKRAFFHVVLACTAVQSFGQGTVTLNNRVVGVGITHVWYGGQCVQGNSSIDVPPGTNSYDGFILTGAPGGPNPATTFATLIGAPGSNAPESSLVASVTPPTTFRAGAAAGYVFPTTDVFTNIPPDAPVATFELVVWDNSTGFYPTWQQASADLGSAATRSAPFVLTNIGGIVYTPPNLIGLQSFSWGHWDDCALLIVQILQHPTNQAAVIGGHAMFNVVARTWSSTNYQWYFNNSPIPGATTADLPLNNLQVSNFGPYFVVVSNSWSLGPPVFFPPRTSAVANLTFAHSTSIAGFQSGPTSKLSFPTEVGPDYIVEYKTNLTDTAWIQLSTNAGTGQTITISDTTAGIASRFYRVHLF
jgi:hypothetical protein